MSEDTATGDVCTFAKMPKELATIQDHQLTCTTPASYPLEWVHPFQTYHGHGYPHMPAPGYFPSSAGAAPPPHTYMWGSQPLLPPYATHPPFATMYACAGLYGHPSMLPGTNPYSTYGLPLKNTKEAQGDEKPVADDVDAKSGSGKTQRSLKRSRCSMESLEMPSGKLNEGAKGSLASATEAFSHSRDNASEGSSGGSEEDYHGVDEGREGGTYQAMSEDVGPLTNLNIGMGCYYYGNQGQSSNTSSIVPSIVRPGEDNEPWLQDEKEMKRQKRKQSNRESARRSRQRKQKESEELAAQVETLTGENSSLRDDLNRIHEQCNKLSTENRLLMEQLEMRRIQSKHSAEGANRNSSRPLRTDRSWGTQASRDLSNEYFHRESNATFAISNKVAVHCK